MRKNCFLKRIKPETAIVTTLRLPLLLFESDEPVEDHRVLQYFKGRELHVCLVVGDGGGVGAGVVSPLVEPHDEDESEEEVSVVGQGHPVRLIST